MQKERPTSRKLLNERAQKYWGEKQKTMLTRHYDQTVKIENAQRWVCKIKICGAVIATSTEYTNQKDALEEASLRALGWMDDNDYR